jgi:hypothetical protein
MPARFEPLSHCPLDVASRGRVMGQQFGLAFDEIGTSQRRNTEVRLTHRWREVDSNLYGAFPVKSCFWFVAGSLFGAGKPFLVRSPAIRFAERADGVKGPKR